MKLFIQHRVNQRAGLSGLDQSWGVEIDLRSDPRVPGSLHLAHDPWSPGESFTDWLDAYCARGLRGPLILNTKEDGLEERALELVTAHGLTEIFFLDTALPTLVRWTGRGEHRFAVRCSRFEPASTALPFVGRCEWAWLDCFDGVPLTLAEIELLRPHFRLCLVSPELQGRPLDDIGRFAEIYGVCHAVCTKSPAAWMQRFGR
jgi:hypothetical protein